MKSCKTKRNSTLEEYNNKKVSQFAKIPTFSRLMERGLFFDYIEKISCEDALNLTPEVGP